METVECFDVLESFGFKTEGIFSDVSELDMVDVTGGGCAGGGSGCACLCSCYGIFAYGQPINY